jgi:predicted HD phosphohydrolase
MSPADQAAFLMLPFAHDAIGLRRIDERAKDPAAITPSLEDILARHLGAAIRAGAGDQK